MKRAPVALAVCFCIGIAAQARLRLPAWLVYGLLTAGIAGCRLTLRRPVGFACFSLGAVAFAGAAVLAARDMLPADHIARARCYLNSRQCEIQGVVIQEPQERGNLTSLILQVRQIRTAHLMRECSGRVQVYIPRETQVGYGDRIRACGRLGMPASVVRARQQAGFREYLRREQLYRTLRVRSSSRIERLPGFHGSRVMLLALRLKQRMNVLLGRRVSPVAAGMLQAMILGEKRAVPRALYRSMIKTGTVHILVVSGFNVGVVACILVVALRLMRLPGRLRCICVAPFLILYCLVTGASPPVVRATIMALFFLFAPAVQREPDIFNSCALAGLCILVPNPRELFDPGFQLSFSSVLSIAGLYPRLRSLFPPATGCVKPVAWLLDNFLISCAAWMGTAGFIAYYFRMISPVTVLANILIPGLAGLITICGFFILAAETACPCFAHIFGSASECMCACLLQLNALLVRIPRGCFYLG